jgi:hypothetical protein
MTGPGPPAIEGVTAGATSGVPTVESATSAPSAGPTAGSRPAHTCGSATPSGAIRRRLGALPASPDPPDPSGSPGSPGSLAT